MFRAELEKKERCTYDDYYSWDSDKRWELLDGVALEMSAPNQIHQEILVELTTQFRVFLRGKECRVFAAPFDVRLDPDGEDDNVVQPDLLVVCDKEKLDGKCCRGFPDLVVEILSPSSVRRDRVDKLRIYKRFGVREIWIVDPASESVEMYFGEGGKYWSEVFDDKVESKVLDGFTVELKEVFEDLG